jgi:hypothetical protein
MPNPQYSRKNQNGIRNASDRVVVVAARFALDEYLKYSTYICQPHRTFQPSARMAFYTKNKIDRHIPKILGQIEAISRDEIDTRTDLSDSDKARLRTLLSKLESARSEEWRKNQLKIVFLSPPDSPDTLVLPNDIANNLTSGNGRGTAFTRGQRYVSLSRLEKRPGQGQAQPLPYTKCASPPTRHNGARSAQASMVGVPLAGTLRLVFCGYLRRLPYRGGLGTYAPLIGLAQNLGSITRRNLVRQIFLLPRRAAVMLPEQIVLQILVHGLFRFPA